MSTHWIHGTYVNFVFVYHAVSNASMHPMRCKYSGSQCALVRMGTVESMDDECRKVVFKAGGLSCLARPIQRKESGSRPLSSTDFLLGDCRNRYNIAENSCILLLLLLLLEQQQ